MNVDSLMCTIEHHFYWCKQTKDFWKNVQNWAKDNIDTTMDLTVCEIIFGINILNNDSIDAINFLILIGKLFINKSKTNEELLYFIKFIALLKDKIECIIYIENINNEEV